MLNHQGRMRNVAPLAAVAAGAVMLLAGCATGTGTGTTQGGGAGNAAAPGVQLTLPAGTVTQSGTGAGSGTGGQSGQGGQTGSSGANGSTGSNGSGSNGSNGSNGSGSNGSNSSNSGQGGGTITGCTLSELGVSVGGAMSGAAANTSARPIVLTNKGSVACTVLGYPGVAALNGGGNQVFQASRAGSGGASTVTIQPGASASAVLYSLTGFPWTPPAGLCKSVPNLLVTPPNETHSQQVSIGTQMCVAPSLTTLLPGTDGGGAISAEAAFILARNLWVAGSTAISADENLYWAPEASILSAAVSSGVSGVNGFAEMVQNLNQLVTLPDADMTPAQNNEFINDTGALNTFYSSPGLYS